MNSTAAQLAWRVTQALIVSPVLAAAMASIPYPDICRFCEAGQQPWWFCVLSGCWW
jgi:hypothetical protein